MLAGGDMQILTAKIAKKNNYKLLVTDKNKNAPCRHIADKFYDVDTVDIKKNYQIIKKLNFNISGVFTIANGGCKSVSGGTSEMDSGYSINRWPI